MANETPAQALERNLSHRRIKGVTMQTLSVRIPQEAIDNLDDLCSELKCLRGDMLRALVNREHENTFEN